jgi:hypothetical protein
MIGRERSMLWMIIFHPVDPRDSLPQTGHMLLTYIRNAPYCFLSIKSYALGLLVLLVSNAASAENSLWLVRPLYPGQEALVERTEKALDRLISPAVRKEVSIGTKELSAALRGKKFEEVPCFSGDTRCSDPIDALAEGLGFARIVMIQGGQDETGYKFKVTSFEPATGKTNPASAANQNLEKALLGAIAKVVPVASSLDVKSTPSGATVFVDDVKVGVTPLSTQVIPGERVVRIDLKLHQPIEENVVIPMRGNASVSKVLEKVAARIMVTASPAGSEISIDGQFLAKDKVDRGISPGMHTVRLTAKDYKAFEQSITVKADEQYNLDKSLEPLAGVVLGPNAPPRELSGRALTETEKTKERKAYFQGQFGIENWGATFLGGPAGGTTNYSSKFGDITSTNRSLIGGSIQYGQYGGIFGLQAIGLGFHVARTRWSFGVNQAIETVKGNTPPTEVAASLFVLTIAPVQPQVRFAIGRFQLSIQGGIEIQTSYGTNVRNSVNGLESEPDKDANFFAKDDKNILAVDFRLSGRAALRFYIVDGLYALVSGGAGVGIVNIWPQFGAPVPNVNYGFSGGIGYGF